MSAGLAFAVVAVVAVAIVAYSLWRKHKTEEAFQLLLTREQLSPTSTPCGLGTAFLAQLRACPEGDRNFGVKYGVTGQRQLTIDGTESETECAAFLWWWEERHTSMDSKGRTTTRYVTHDRIVGAVRLPHAAPSVSVAPEGWFTRLGIGGRGDMQVESEEFNRRFDVRTNEADLPLVIRLLDAQYQRLLLEMFQGRGIEIAGDVLLVSGDPPGEVGDLFGDIAELPGARRDAALLAGRIPESFWRGVAAAGGSS